MTYKTQKNKIIFRRVWLAVVVLLLSVIQNGQGLFPQIFGARALILIPTVVAISMYERDIAGMFFGLFAGALWDIFAGGNNFNAIFLFVIGFACGSLINTLMRNNIVTHFLLSSVTSFLYILGYWLYHYVFINMDKAALMLVKYFVPTAIYTIILSPVIFLIIRAIERKFRVDEFANLQ